MKGCALAAKQDFELAIVGSWHTAVFGVRAYSGKLGKLDKYLGTTKAAKPQTPDEMLAVFQQFHARGVPMNIKKLN